MAVLRLPLSQLARLAALLILPAGALVPASRLHAESPDPFTVRDVQENFTDSNLSLARDHALLAGQRDAYLTMLQRLTATADWPRLPRPASDGELQDAVLDVGIDQEKRSSIRYLATLSVRFKPDMIRRILRSANIPYAEWRGRPVPVLPVLIGEDSKVIADGANPWRDAWRSSAAQGVIPFVVPQPVENGFSAAQLTAVGPDGLAALSQRYGTEDVLVAVATPQRIDGGKLKVEVSVAGIGPVGSPLTGTRSYDGETGETLDVVLRRAVEDIAKAADDAWKAGNLLQYDHASALTVIVPLSGLEDWLTVRDRLTRSTPVRSYEVAALSRTEAALVLHYVGEQAQLESILMQNGMVLTWLDDHWILRNTAMRPGGSAR